MKRFIKLIIGLLLLPACPAVAIAIYRLFRISAETAPIDGFEAWALPSGFIIGVFVFILMPRPTRTYVFGHEMTHALWALLSGSRIGRLRVGKDGGHVELSKTNFIIALAPYFFPFYTFLVITAYGIASIWLDLEASRGWWLTAVGLTWAFHLTFTIQVLTANQPDIKEHGWLFSYIIILLANLLTIGLWLVWMSEPTHADLLRLLKEESFRYYGLVGSFLAEQTERLWMLIKN